MMPMFDMDNALKFYNEALGSKSPLTQEFSTMQKSAWMNRYLELDFMRLAAVNRKKAKRD